MRSTRSIIVLGIIVVSAGFIAFALLPNVEAQRGTTTVNWPLHNLDLAGSRYSPMDQINPSNVKTLTPRWLFQYGVIDGVSNQTTPVIVDGMMYVTDSRGSVYAVNAADGHLLWTFDVTQLLGGGAAKATSSVTAASLRRRRRLHRRRIVSLRARRKNRKADPNFRQGRPGERHPRRHQAALSPK